MSCLETCHTNSQIITMNRSCFTIIFQSMNAWKKILLIIFLVVKSFHPVTIGFRQIPQKIISLTPLVDLVNQISCTDCIIKFWRIEIGMNWSNLVKKLLIVYLCRVYTCEMTLSPQHVPSLTIDTSKFSYLNWHLISKRVPKAQVFSKSLNYFDNVISTFQGIRY